MTLCNQHSAEQCIDVQSQSCRPYVFVCSCAVQYTLCSICIQCGFSSDIKKEDAEKKKEEKKKYNSRNAGSAGEGELPIIQW